MKQNRRRRKRKRRTRTREIDKIEEMHNAIAHHLMTDAQPEVCVPKAQSALLWVIPPVYVLGMKF